MRAFSTRLRPIPPLWACVVGLFFLCGPILPLWAYSSFVGLFFLCGPVLWVTSKVQHYGSRQSSRTSRFRNNMSWPVQPFPVAVEQDKSFLNVFTASLCSQNLWPKISPGRRLWRMVPANALKVYRKHYPCHDWRNYKLYFLGTQFLSSESSDCNNDQR